MKRPKLIALDMDGTMLDERSRLTERTKAALRAAQEAGVRVAVATGRMYPSAMVHIRDAGIESASIFYNGALIRDPLTDETIYEKNLGAELTAEILSFFRERGWYIQIYSDDRLIVKDASDERCKYYEDICGLKAMSLGDNFWSCGLDSAKLLGISFDREIFLQMCNEVRQRFGGRIYQATSWNAFVEIVHPTVNKAEGLKRVSCRYDIAREEVMAIGDGGNDAEMIRWAGIGVAMGNAKEAVKKAADIVAPPNSEDGAAWAIEAALAL
ncbi:MAG: Cof-type HAD-IIB family hydrolase [Synergistaceae bacterium]|nr:Cof-type HAD-IIB family hydrolase [Synergistaceae bacterium]